MKIINNLLIIMTLGIFAFGSSADAKRNRVKVQDVDFSTCPYSGLPPIDAFTDDNITISELKFNLTRAAHASAFQRMMASCNAQAALDPYIAWRQARAVVIAKSVEAVAYAATAATKAMNAETDEEREAIAREAAEVAARFALELTPLVADAKMKKQLFTTILSASVAP